MGSDGREEEASPTDIEPELGVTFKAARYLRWKSPTVAAASSGVPVGQ
jgi:hypothetical protein